MGMSGDIHLLIDEAGGAHSPDFAGAPETIWRATEDRQSVVYTFPPAHRLAQASENELRECKLGYRAKNLRATARLVSSGEADLKTWSALSDAELRKQLCALPGVGPKIANCVMLFAYERLRAFPIDVWIERVLRQHYFSRRKKMTSRRLREFSETYFGEHGGYAQQYLFHHARSGGRGDRAIEVNRPYLRRNERRRGGSPDPVAAQVVRACGLR